MNSRQRHSNVCMRLEEQQASGCLLACKRDRRQIQAQPCKWLSAMSPDRRSLRVPAGVDTDSRLRVRGEGNAGRRGGPTGDLFVFITVKSDSGGQLSCYGGVFNRHVCSTDMQ